jgi:outer membrane lipoprotein SlyB
MNFKKPMILITALVLSACASPAVDRSAAGFDEDKFVTDLNDCRGGPWAQAIMLGVGIGAWGALEGVAVGAAHGGDAAGEAAIIGAAVGGVLGLGVGAVDALTKRDEKVRGCVAGKGYRVL